MQMVIGHCGLIHTFISLALAVLEFQQISRNILFHLRSFCFAFFFLVLFGSGLLSWIESRACRCILVYGSPSTEKMWNFGADNCTNTKANGIRSQLCCTVVQHFILQFCEFVHLKGGCSNTVVV